MLSSGLHMCITACMLRNLTTPAEVAVCDPGTVEASGQPWQPSEMETEETRQVNKPMHNTSLGLSIYSGGAGFYYKGCRCIYAHKHLRETKGCAAKRSL